jgi:L-amino acid N-acyltransferase YncA
MTKSPSERPAIRAARAEDAFRLAEIFNQGVAERQATFQTREQSATEMAEVISGGGPALVAELGGEVVAWAKVGAYDDAHAYYAGIGEGTMYVARGARRRGVGAALLDALATAAERAGYYKLIGKIFTTNRPSIELVHACGWHDVGVHRRHGRLEGEWKDVLVVEKQLGDAAD